MRRAAVPSYCRAIEAPGSPGASKIDGIPGLMAKIRDLWPKSAVRPDYCGRRKRFHYRPEGGDVILGGEGV